MASSLPTSHFARTRPSAKITSSTSWGKRARREARAPFSHLMLLHSVRTVWETTSSAKTPELGVCNRVSIPNGESYWSAATWLTALLRLEWKNYLSSRRREKSLDGRPTPAPLVHFPMIHGFLACCNYRVLGSTGEARWPYSTTAIDVVCCAVSLAGSYFKGLGATGASSSSAPVPCISSARSGWQSAALRYSPSATGLRNCPTPSIDTSITSPATTGPTPLGVPVAIRSPGSRVMICEM